MARLFARPPPADTVLAGHQTGVGRPVIDRLVQARVRANLRPVTITGGHRAAPGEGCGLRVPKKGLLVALRVVLQGGRPTVARHPRDAATLADELRAFQVMSATTAHETFGAGREGRYDDLVLAVAVAAWTWEHIPTG
jgi:hypothetical protein